MRFPFVSRDIYDALHADYQVLLDKYHALKVGGAAPVEAAVALPARESDPVMEAITAVCGTDKRLRAIMAKQAMKDRMLGASDDDIIRTIYQGVPDDMGLPA